MSKSRFPIPLTCGEDRVVVDEHCIHAFPNGACDLDSQFMCPVFLQFEKTHPEEVKNVLGFDVTLEELRKVQARAPYQIPDVSKMKKNARKRSK